MNPTEVYAQYTCGSMKAVPNAHPIRSPAHAPQRPRANHNTTIAASANGQIFASGSARAMKMPATTASARLLSNRMRKDYGFAPASVRNDAPAHRRDRLPRRFANRSGTRCVRDLVERIDDLLAPPHHVAGRDLRAAQHRRKAAPLRPTMDGAHDPPLRARQLRKPVFGMEVIDPCPDARGVCKRAPQHPLRAAGDARGAVFILSPAVVEQ